MAKKDPKIAAQERAWRAQDALATLTRAETIRTDAKLMADVRKYANSQVKTLAKVALTPTNRRAK